MITTLREFLVRSADGEELEMSECLIENDTTTNHSETRTKFRDRYFRERVGGHRARRAKQIEPGVFQLEDGKTYREVT